MADQHLLPFVRASELAASSPTEQRWLIDKLWAAEAVGVIGGAPKCCKSWLGLEMAVSIATGTPCLGSFHTECKGKALIYMAEDAEHTVRDRLEALSRHRGASLAGLDIFVITSPTLRIDLEAQQQRLRATVAQLKPDLLLLDPLVRLHRRDENSAADVSELLAYLRVLQRELHTAVAIVHHTRKNASAGQPGQGLRGSGDLHAFGDSNLYLRRRADSLVLSIEHRAAPSPPSLELRLVSGHSPHLELVAITTSPESSLLDSVKDVILNAEQPVTRASIRQHLKARNESVGQALACLEGLGAIERVTTGWRAATKQPNLTVPAFPP